ncbi:DUF1501 domain-containing protein [Agarilytica rhodophyticola]|uniref:DUF1501 domain-containing protein n=1 Tax=Agarilytica rhodophyticola TaxID=1737490 RepID=UPI000B343471|nr:DUF1501 domain-containing protein [Agarilytica rhodophyticola]
MKKSTRREFIKRSGAALALGVGTSVAAGLGFSRQTYAQTQPYRATVFIFFKGGMDHLETVIPYDTESFNELVGHRQDIFAAYESDAIGASRRRSDLLPLNPLNASDFGGREFAMPRELAPIHEMFENEDLSIISGIGPLIEPATRSQIQSKTVRTPTRLFSHNDQQSVWGTLGTEGTRFGWGGRILDALVPSNSPGSIFASVAAGSGSSDSFLYGENFSPISYNGGVPSVPNILQGRFIGFRNNDAMALTDQYMRKTYPLADGLFQHDFKERLKTSLATRDRLREELSDVPALTTEFPNSNLGNQLKSILELISIRSKVSIGHQIFYANIGGFDTHANNVTRVPALHQSFASEIKAFRDGLVAIGEWNNVTTFTASDFGRTLVGNGSGTDHAWGSMHFIMGGSVRGKRIVGQAPSLDTSSQRYLDKRGSWIPEISIEQLGATVGNWMGAKGVDLEQIFPNLSNFDNSTLDLFT